MTTQHPILVYEAYGPLRTALTWLLEAMMLPVVSAGTLPAAAAQLQTGRPALLLLDVPAVGGPELGLATAARARYGPAMPLIVLSGDDRVQQHARQLGACRVLPLPFEPDDLQAAVRAALVQASPAIATLPVAS